MIGSAESFLTLSEATRLLPNRPHVGAIWRMARRGVVGRNGKRVFLEHSRFGRKLYTTREALERFRVELGAADREHFDQVRNHVAKLTNVRTRKPSRTKRETEIRNAEKRLLKAGI